MGIFYLIPKKCRVPFFLFHAMGRDGHIATPLLSLTSWHICSKDCRGLEELPRAPGRDGKHNPIHPIHRFQTEEEPFASAHQCWLLQTISEHGECLDPTGLPGLHSLRNNPAQRCQCSVWLNSLTKHWERKITLTGTLFPKWEGTLTFLFFPFSLLLFFNPEGQIHNRHMSYVQSPDQFVPAEEPSES